MSEVRFGESKILIGHLDSMCYFIPIDGVLMAPPRMSEVEFMVWAEESIYMVFVDGVIIN